MRRTSDTLMMPRAKSHPVRCSAILAAALCILAAAGVALAAPPRFTLEIAPASAEVVQGQAAHADLYVNSTSGTPVKRWNSEISR